MIDYRAKPDCEAFVLIAFAILIASLNIVGLRDLTDNIFSWHIMQPEFRHGILELLVILGVIFVALRAGLTPLVRSAVVVVVCTFYLRSHAVDLAFLGSAAYATGIYAAGILIDKHLFPREAMEKGAFGRQVATGVTFFSLVLFSVSFAWGASFELIRAIGLGISLACITLVSVLSRSRSVPVGLSKKNTLSAAGYSLAIVLILAVMARSNVVFYYDSIWYGMRPDRVLFGPTGIYDFLGLTTQVHYYPKLYEVLIAPLQEWGDHSLAIGFGAASLAWFGYAIWVLGSKSGLSSQTALLLAISLASVPAAAGSAETTKGDLLASGFVLLALASLMDWSALRNPRHLSEVVTYALLASMLRLSVLPWLALLLLLFLGVTARNIWLDRLHYRRLLPRSETVLIICTLILFFLVHFRTWLLTGTPVITNASTQITLEQWGFAMKYPIGILTGAAEAEGLFSTLRYLPLLALSPSGYEFHAFKWTGASWLALAPLAVAAPVIIKGYWKNGLWIVGLTGAGLPLLLAYNSWQVHGGDGNYFIVPTACICISGLSALRSSRGIDLALIVAAMIGIGAYMAGANWVQGTSKFDLVLDKSVFDQQSQTERFLEKGALNPLANALNSCDSQTRVIGLLDLPYAFALPVRYEPIQELLWNNPKTMRSSAEFVRFISATNTQLVITPNTETTIRNPLIAAQFSEIAPIISSAIHMQSLEVIGELDGYFLLENTNHRIEKECRSALLISEHFLP